MCGYACCNCGRCRGEKPKHVVALDKVPGYCNSCGTLNGPSSSTCKACGTALQAVLVPNTNPLPKHSPAH